MDLEVQKRPPWNLLQKKTLWPPYAEPQQGHMLPRQAAEERTLRMCVGPCSTHLSGLGRGRASVLTRGLQGTGGYVSTHSVPRALDASCPPWGTGAPPTG